MPVHAGVRPEHLAEALTSLAGQTRRADETVVVVDGPVPDEHEAVLGRFADLVVVRSTTQQGAGPALSRGLSACRGTYVARADSDDVNEPDRLARQLALLTATGADLCSTAMVEFESDPYRVRGVRRTAVEHAEFARLMPGRNPVNHPTVVFRRATAQAVGGYGDLPLLEDYDLWARMLVGGARFVGLDAALVRYRVDGMHERRTGSTARTSEVELQRRLVSYGLVSPARGRLNLVVRGTYHRLPRPVLERVYALLFRRARIAR
ncbi:glycosyltransferase [Nocardioides rubriscoriae]|uniref:glycosyltransferase n=1 Tax=Nocardioides rubriscoriae TaxID=642762 RepID=UPI0011DF90B4|nr:glycosyltransferase [Nocardioides rubriscoriae]